MSARRRHREEVRLVRDYQVGVDMQNRLLEWNRCLIRDFAEIADLRAHPIRRVNREWRTRCIQHPAAREAIEPHLARNCRETRAQTVEHRSPRTGRKLQAAGGQTVRITHRVAHP